MERRRTFSSRARLAGLALLVTAAAPGSGGSGPLGRSAVATVNGHHITQDEVSQQIEAQKGLAKAQAKANKASKSDTAAALKPFAASGVGTLSTAQAADGLSTLVRIEILRDAVRANKGKVTVADRATARTALESEAKSAKLTLADLPKVFVTTQVELSALQNVLGKSIPPDDAALRAEYEKQKASLANMCVSIVVTADQASSQAAYDRIKGGEDFAAVSKALSTDANLVAANGAAGCAAPSAVASSLGATLLTAKSGDLVPPTQNQGSWLVVKVTSITVPTFAQAKRKLKSTANQAKVSAELDKALRRADVTIDSRYGTWDRKNATVVPPVDPKATSTTTSTTTPAGP